MSRRPSNTQPITKVTSERKVEGDVSAGAAVPLLAMSQQRHAPASTAAGPHIGHVCTSATTDEMVCDDLLLKEIFC